MPTLAMPVTAIYASILGILIAFLMLAVIRLRRSLKVGLGDGGHEKLRCAIRAHGNATETIPIFLILFALLEANGGKPMFLHICGAVFVAARIYHAFGVTGNSGVSNGRLSGTFITIAVFFTLATANLVKVFA